MYSYLATPNATRAVLERHGLLLKHHLGQNFLINDGVIGNILRLAEPTCNNVILEIGPGIGALTVALLNSGATVQAIEADHSLVPVLDETCADPLERLHLTLGDALKIDLRALDPAPTMLVSNLPYQVAATLVLRAFEQLPHLSRAVVMVQAEVADRMAAQAGNKTYGAYTAKLRLYGEITGRFNVDRRSFMPAPHVDSAVIRIDRKPTVLTERVIGETSKVIDAAFAQRRKTIRNSMAASGFEKELLDEAFVAADIVPNCRAESLSCEDFIRLSQALLACRDKLL